MDGLESGVADPDYVDTGKVEFGRGALAKSLPSFLVSFLRLADIRLISVVVLLWWSLCSCSLGTDSSRRLSCGSPLLARPG